MDDDAPEEADETYDNNNAELPEDGLHVNSAEALLSSDSATTDTVTLRCLVDGGSNVNLGKSRSLVDIGSYMSSGSLKIGSCDATTSLVSNGTVALSIQPSGGVGTAPQPTRINL